MRPEWYIDECLDGPKLHAKLTEHKFIFESHIARYGRGVDDSIWVPMICVEKKIILTADLSRDRKITPLLRENQGCAVLVLPQLAPRVDLLVDRLLAMQRRIEAAFEREPLIIRLNASKCEARRHDAPAVAYTVRGNGSLKEPPAPKQRSSKRKRK